MKLDMLTTISPTTRLGSPGVEEQVRQAAANIVLEGCKPSDLAFEKARLMASRQLTAEQVLADLRALYVSRSR